MIFYVKYGIIQVYNLTNDSFIQKGYGYMCIYGYCRISKAKQNIERQVRNIKTAYPDAIIIQEAFTGRKLNRPQWVKLYNALQPDDTLVFDSVSRMSRNAEEGFSLYKNLYERNINLVFLKERHIDTHSYREAMSGIIDIEIQAGDEATNELVKGIMASINRFMMNKVSHDIYKAFQQSEKEVEDLRQRTREGIATARINGKQIGQKAGISLHIKKSDPIKQIILEKSRDFKGHNTDGEVLAILDKSFIKVEGKHEEIVAHISRNTYYKYKRELAESFI